MADSPITIMVDPESELAHALRDAQNAPVRLNVRGVSYRVSREEDDLWADYDPAKVKAALSAFAGTITADEAERLKQRVYEGREQGTRPADRP